jgi:hypothetical protein
MFATGINTEFDPVVVLPPRASAAPSNSVSKSSGHRAPVRLPVKVQFDGEYVGGFNAVCVVATAGQADPEAAHSQLSPPIKIPGPVPVAQLPPGTTLLQASAAGLPTGP